MVTSTISPAVAPAKRPLPTPKRASASPARTRPRWPARLGILFIGAGLALVPWLFVLASSLPATATASHWPIAWVGLDTLEALALITTGVLLTRRDPRGCLTAMVTATLLTADEWFDVSTAAPGADRVPSPWPSARRAWTRRNWPGWPPRPWRGSAGPLTGRSPASTSPK